MKTLDAKSLLVGAALAILGLLAMGQRSLQMPDAGRYQATLSQDGQVVVVCDTATGRLVQFSGAVPAGADFETSLRMRSR